jgi:hypothetical protein
MYISSLKYFFNYLTKDLSSNFYFWIRNIFKKIQNIIKISRIFYPKFFFLKSVNKKKIATLTFFVIVNIFSDSYLKNHNMFICHFLSTFLRNIMKNFRKSSPKFFINAFLNFCWKIRPNQLCYFLVSIGFPYFNR